VQRHNRGVHQRPLRIIAGEGFLEELDEPLRGLAEHYPHLQLKLGNIPRDRLARVLREEQRRYVSDLGPCNVSFRIIPDLVRQHMIKSLDDLLPAKRRGAFTQEALALASHDGRIYGIPDDISPYMLVARKDLLKGAGCKPARSFADLLEQIESDKARLAIEHLPLGNLSAALGFWSMLVSVLGIDRDTQLADLLRDENTLIEIFDHARRLDAVTDLAERFQTGTGTSGGEQLASGEVHYLFSWVGALSRRPVEVLKHIELLPLGKADTWIPIQGSGWVVPENTASPDASADILRICASRDFMRRCELRGGYTFPALRALWQDEDILRQKPHYHTAFDLFDGRRRFEPLLLDAEHELLLRSLIETLYEQRTARDWIARLRDSDHAAARSHIAGAVVSRALSYIEAHLPEIKRVGDVARQVDLHPDHLNVLFRKELGRSCWAYIGERRMSRAVELLADVTLGVKEIATRLGMNPAYFNQAFRRCYGCSATQMRRRLIEY